MLPKLLSDGIISSDQLHVATIEATRSHCSTEEALVSLGFLSERVLWDLKASEGNLETIDLTKTVVDVSLLQKIPKSFALKYEILPVARHTAGIEVALTDPLNLMGLDLLRNHLDTTMPFLKRLVSKSGLLETIDLYYDQEASLSDLLKSMETPNSTQNPVVRLVHQLLWEAVRLKASDLHFEPDDRFVRVRVRINGDLQQMLTFHKDYWPSLAVRFKVICGMNITESRKPQNGRLSLHLSGRDIDFRLSTHPVVHGESLVVRILDKAYALRTLSELGLLPADEALILEAAQKPHGLIIMTGPTGSGKTTTLYSVLRHIQKPTLNIMTLEQPVEYQLPGIRQTEILEENEFTFAQGIRSILRHDPDVILVGEIRDSDTARMALRAAITGHQVLTTLHTQDVFGVFPRLKELGINVSLLEGHLSLVLAQRLLKKLCPLCKIPRPPTAYEKNVFLENDLSAVDLIWDKGGCEACHHTGYQGRFAVLDLLSLTQVSLQKSYSDMKKEAQKTGFKSFFRKALDQVLRGTTTFAEALTLRA